MFTKLSPHFALSKCLHIEGINYHPKENRHLSSTSNGFNIIDLVRETCVNKKTPEQTVISININGEENFEKFAWFSTDSIAEVHFYQPETVEEQIQAHGGMRCIPDSAKKYIGKNVNDVVTELNDAGFTNINIEAQKTRKTLFIKDETIVQITVNGSSEFEKGDWIEPEAEIQIAYVQLV